MNIITCRHILFFFFVLFFSSAQASSVRIEGIAKDHEGSSIFALVYDDIYTQTLKKVAEAKINSDGSFELDIPCEQTMYVQLRFNYLNAKLWVQPQQNYSLTFLPLAEGQSISINNKTQVPYNFNGLDENDINYKMLSYNHDFDKFLADHYTLIQKMMAPPSSNFQRRINGDTLESAESSVGISQQSEFIKELEKFKDEMNLKYSEKQNSFFRIFMDMSIAKFLINSGQKNRAIFDEFLKDQENHFYHTHYHDFLKSFNKAYFAKFIEKWGENGLASHIENANLKEIRTTLRKDDFIDDSEMLDYVIIHALYEVQNNGALSKSGMRSIINQLITDGESIYIKNLAKFVLRKMNKTENGFPAYNFSLPNSKNENVSLSDFKGEFVLINFWADWCQTCKKEMSLLSQLNDQYGRHIQFVSVNLDEDQSKQASYLSRNKNYNWDFLLGSIDPLVAESFDILSLPGFVLIDQDGNFLNSYCKKPSEGLEKTLFTIYQKQETRQKSKKRTGRN